MTLVLSTKKRDRAALQAVFVGGPALVHPCKIKRDDVRICYEADAEVPVLRLSVIREIIEHELDTFSRPDMPDELLLSEEEQDMRRHEHCVLERAARVLDNPEFGFAAVEVILREPEVVELLYG